jgi:hypothetical protein
MMGRARPETPRRAVQTAKWTARIGAGFYVLWGIFHLVAANSVYALAQQSTGVVQGQLLQDASYLVFFAISGILMAVVLNWRNDKQAPRGCRHPVHTIRARSRPHSLVAGLGRTATLADLLQCEFSSY